MLNRLLACVRRSARVQSMREAKEREDKFLDDLSELEAYSDHSSHEQDAAEIFLILYLEYC